MTRLPRHTSTIRALTSLAAQYKALTAKPNRTSTVLTLPHLDCPAFPNRATPDRAFPYLTLAAEPRPTQHRPTQPRQAAPRLPSFARPFLAIASLTVPWLPRDQARLASQTPTGLRSCGVGKVTRRPRTCRASRSSPGATRRRRRRTRRC